MKGSGEHLLRVSRLYRLELTLNHTLNHHQEETFHSRTEWYGVLEPMSYYSILVSYNKFSCLYVPSPRIHLPEDNGVLCTTILKISCC